MNYPELERLIQIIKDIRHPQTGCPWDLKQTHQSLIKYLIEESYEYKHATELNSDELMEEEIGDVLLQVLLHSQIADDRKSFNIESVAKKLADKMVRRHPHVFSTPGSADSSEEVIENWQKIKEQEKGKKKYFFSENDFNLPALMASHKIGKKSKEVNFDWDTVEQVLAKVDEELLEVKEEIQQNSHEKTKEEIGDLLFSVAQLSRHLNIDPEEALRDANKKFIRRFNKVEDVVNSQNKKIQDYSLDELESIWQKIKN